MSHRNNEESREPSQPRIQEAIGQSESFLAFQERVSRVAKVDRPVLLVGERGSGKELAAARLHYLSGRWQEPFLALNCAALLASLIESELFGHEAGAFTGAAGRRAGRFEAADGGTFFLDEIGAIPIVAQEKILRAVEYGTFERVGGSEPIQVNVRIIAATNADLPTLVARQDFNPDLLDRLSFEVLFVPPLRERREDIMVLATHFGARMAYELGWDGVPEFTDEAVNVLEAYPWPGNVRELKNVVERAVYRSDDDIITAEEVVFDPFQSPYSSAPERMGNAVPNDVSVLPESQPSSPSSGDLLANPIQETIQNLELQMLEEALRRAQFNQRKAADMLGLTYHQFRGLYRKYRNRLSG